MLENGNGFIGYSSQLTDAQFTDAQLTDAQFTDAQLTDAQFTDAQLTLPQVIGSLPVHNNWLASMPVFDVSVVVPCTAA